MEKRSVRVIELRENREDIMKICDDTGEFLNREFNIDITNTEVYATIVYGFLRCAIEHLNKIKSQDKDVEINMMQLFDLGISYRENDDAEKEGNYAPYLTPGQEMKLLVKDDNDTEE